jgi:hypothetical protein
MLSKTGLDLAVKVHCT